LPASAVSKADLTPTVSHTPHGEVKREELVRAAFDLIAERGFEGLRTRDVASRAGVTVATLHYYFHTKEHLIRGVMAFTVEKFRTRRLSDPRPDDLDPLAELLRILGIRGQQRRQAPEIFRVLLELTTRASRDPAIKGIMRESDSQWRQNISDILRAGVQKRVFRADLDVAAATTILGALSRGRSMLSMLRPDISEDEHVDAEVERWLTGRSKAPTR